MENKTILVVDDDPAVINTIFTVISTSNPEIIFFQANSGTLGLQIALKKIPDLVITDWDMPEMNGIEFIRRLKAEKKTNPIPVIMASGVMTTSENLQTALAAGAVDFIRKPIDPIELAARVNSMLLLSGYINDIHKKSETIAQNNKFLNELINTIPYPIAHYDHSGKILLYNRKFKEIQTAEEPMVFYSSFLRDGVDIHFKQDQRLLSNNEKVINYECQITLPSNEKRDTIFTKASVHDLEGKLQGIICVISDVTELKRVHKEALEQQKNDLASISMRLIQTCELNEKIIADIAKLSTHTNKNGSDLIREIISNYRYAINDNIWDEFERRFNDVHSDFYKKLGEAHPDLTTNERKLCAFLKLNMSSKEIASITYQNLKSIDMARYRLRKKLGLGEDVNMLSYFSKF
jgi:DNA-binding response OmpR family regulator/DNA-binding CsgD family transcriptional regulator